MSSIFHKKGSAARRRSGLLVVVLGIAACAWGGPGYLRTVGPSPLRFRPIPALPAARPVIPPAPAAVSPEPAAHEADNFLAVPDLLARPLPAPPVEEPAAVTNQAVVLPEPARHDDVVSPQMLLKYFNKSTNGTATGVLAPFEFSPPQTGEPPSSKATYSHSP